MTNHATSLRRSRTPGKIDSRVTSPISFPSNSLLRIRSDQGITQSSNSVSSWSDLSPNGHNFTQSTSERQPTYAANQINGKPSIQFNGNQGLATPHATDLNLTAHTLFLIVKYISGANIVAKNDPSSGSSTDPGRRRHEVRKNTYTIGNDSVGIVSFPTLELGNLWQMFILRVNSSTSTNIYKNAESVSVSTSLNLNNFNSTALTLGYGFNFVERCTCEIAEFALWNTALDDTTINQLKGYTNVFWGIQF